MTYWRLIRSSLLFYRRTHLAVAAAAAVGACVLVGALAVGDSLRYSLVLAAGRRLGGVTVAAEWSGRFFRADLAEDLADDLHTLAAPVLTVSGTAVKPAGGGRANQVRILGVDKRFWSLGEARDPFRAEAAEEVVLNERLARRLGAVAGDVVLLRVAKPSLLPGDAPMSADEDLSVAMRLRVRAIASESDFGRFSLRANQVAPFSAFVDLRLLQKALARPGGANTLLVGGTGQPGPAAEDAQAALRRHWRLADADLELRELPRTNTLELRSGRVFIDPAVEQAAAEVFPHAVGVLTYFVNELRSGPRSTPYSMVTAVGYLDESSAAAPADTSSPISSTSPHQLAATYCNLLQITASWCGMNDDEIVINTWLAEDLQVGAGDEIELEYFVMGPARRLATATSHFRVRRIVPLEGLAADRDLMPEFPGLTDVDNCRNWRPGVPINLDRIRKKDEEYWKRYRGTPKAFVTLRAGGRMWGNRFGGLTAVRFPLAQLSAEEIAGQLRRKIAPGSMGLSFRPVRDEAVKAARKATGFGGLFLGLSSFLIVAAVLLTGLVFVFGTQQRSEQVGTLLALGLPASRIRLMLLAEGCAAATAGAIAGSFCGLLYARAVLAGLGTIWAGAVAGSPASFHVKPVSLAVGGLCGILAAVAAMAITLRKLTRSPVTELLAAGTGVGPSVPPPPSRTRARVALWAGLAAVAGAAAVLAFIGAGSGAESAGAFFAAGSALLAGGLAFVYFLLSSLSGASETATLTPARLVLRNCGRRVGRSVATVAILACGTFLIIAVGANRRDPGAGAGKASSGTGGFAFYAESTLPILYDLNDPEQADRRYGLNPADLEGVSFVPFRLRDGDDASCLNLNRPGNPRLLGVVPELLGRRGSFTFARTAEKTDNGWELLDSDQGMDVVPAIGDEATIAWSLGKTIGDTLTYTDDHGRTFRIRLVGALAGSILQGGLVISERNFVERFGSRSGCRVFLIDAPAEKANRLERVLVRSLRDKGFELTPAVERLRAFYAVENTYISIFQVLGGLGLILGSAGLGVVVLRNIMERRGELALLRAVGFTRRRVRMLLLWEHWGLMGVALACGSAAAVAAVLPATRSAGTAIPHASLAATLGATAGVGALWIFLATTLALREPMLQALRAD